MKTKPILNIVTALQCEANPVITHFKLKKMMDIVTPFPIYFNHDQTIYLVISGIGKVKMASATTYLAVLNGHQKQACFLNIGIAGSSQFLIGQAVIANKITEYSTQRHWYPFVTSLKNKAQSHLVTHDAPQHSYPPKCIIDMEGSAFFQTANLFVSLEHIQLMKIISDNCLQDQQEINKSIIEKLILKNILEVEKLSEDLLNLSARESRQSVDLPWLSLFQEKWYFTHSQQLQLAESLRRWKIKFKNDDPYLFCLNQKNASSIIQSITLKLEEVEKSL